MSESPDFKAPFGAKQIRALLPHRDPFLMVDRVLEIDPGRSIKAIKCVTQNEPWARGHFPEQPIMPGVLMLEAIAQTGALMLLVQPEFRGRTALLAGLKDVRFRRLVLPGDVLTMDVKLESFRMGVGRATGVTTVDSELALKGVLRFAFTEGLAGG